MRVSSRRGSALLIVLGMVAFMVISAVAFSAYMRMTRLPSSYARRVVASRMLAKAALANIIDEIDAAIGDNPHPGVGTQAYKYPRYGGWVRNRNWWKGRVYIGTNTTHLVAQQDTVSPLCLEALAYIPPPLVNEARYYSRHSLGGKWHSLPYDMGRYAFCALDVSDYFDINALSMGMARTSSPDGRISLAYLFEDVDHTRPTSEVDPEEFEKKQSELIEASGKVPFVSMADWNLAVDQADIPGIFSPFCEYVRSSSSMFYSGGNEESYLEQIRRFSFVTDSYFPKQTLSSDDADADYDLNDVANQPFPLDLLRGIDRPRITDILQMHGGLATKGLSRLTESMPAVNFAQLYDYLDENRVPISLALPTCERVPMICSIRPEIKVTLKMNTTKADTEENVKETTRDKVRTITVAIDGQWRQQLRNSNVKVKLVYPFRHSDEGTEKDIFAVDGRIAFFLMNTDTTPSTRSGNVRDVLHDPDGQETVYEQSEFKNGVISLPLQQISPLNMPKNIIRESDAIKDVNAMVVLNQLPDLPDEFAKIVYRWKQTKKTDPDTGLETWEPEEPEDLGAAMESAHCSMPPLLATITPDPAFADDNQFKAALAGGNLSWSLSLMASVWLRVRYEDRDLGSSVVDMVPACLMDDRLPLDKRIANRATDNEMDCSAAAQTFGSLYPLLKFASDGTGDDRDKITVDSQKLKDAPEQFVISNMKEFTVTQQLLTGDPRYNHAPENWFKSSSDDWLANCGRGAGDGDIFMSVSDQGYLQSKYELANLLMNAGGDGLTGGLAYPSGKLDYESSVEQTTQFQSMWRTYTPLTDNGNNWFENVGFCGLDHSFKVNPYTDSTNIMMAAFSNTPLEWRFASTNEVMLERMNIPESHAEFNKNYAWNDFKSSWKKGHIAWLDLEALCGKFMNKVKTSSNWEKTWRELGWENVSQPNQLLPDLPTLEVPEEEGGNLYMADRKFLYGYWRECFAVKQQLFLVFLRAEPSMMGGEAIGATPPQLGVKAMALVWRDPTSYSGSGEGENRPHQTRVLFYRQFE